MFFAQWRGMVTKQLNISDRRPWVSICIATYRRPALLRATLEVLRQQGFADFEVVISDNDPESSARCVVDEYDARFRYIPNETNVGMVKNFNRAISHARGEFVAMLADDDPPMPEFLPVLHDLCQRYPGSGAYFGACQVSMESVEAAASYKVDVGKMKFLAKGPEGSVQNISAAEFPMAFFKGEVFPYVLWSTGIVRRDIVLQIGGMPDYGSPLLTDFAYILLAGSHSGCVTVNTILGCQSVHGRNSGLADPHDIEIALTGCHRYLSTALRHRDDWLTLQKSMESFLGKYIINHAIAMRRYLKVVRPNPGEYRRMERAMRNVFRLKVAKLTRFQYHQAVVMQFLRRSFKVLKHMSKTRV